MAKHSTWRMHLPLDAGPEERYRPVGRVLFPEDVLEAEAKWEARKKRHTSSSKPVAVPAAPPQYYCTACGTPRPPAVGRLPPSWEKWRRCDGCKESGVVISSHFHCLRCGVKTSRPPKSCKVICEGCDAKLHPTG